MRTRLRRARAFTLVELLVVIGIIAALIGILLPVLSGVSARGRDLKCQSNLRTIGQMVMTYAAENRGSLPYGYYYNRSTPGSWTDAGGDGRLTTMWSLISRMSGKQYGGDDVFVNGGNPNPEAKHNGAPFLRCPEAELVLPHICSYDGQFVAFCTPFDEYRVVGSAQPIQDRPAKIDDLFPFTILAYDTAVFPGMINDVGYVTGADVDRQRMWTDRYQRRYYSHADPYGRVPPGVFGQNRQVQFELDWRNIDPTPTGPEGFAGYPYQGNLRFRHAKNTAVNVLYGDGRVESVSGKFNGNKNILKHDVMRKSFMTKWPSGMGIRANPAEPS